VFALDLAITAFRDWYVIGLGASHALPLIAWTWMVDALLSTVGLLAALAARDEPFGALLVMPVVALLSIFSRERTARIDQSLELSRAYRGTTLLLSDVLDDDDSYTAFHSRGVVQLSIAVADRLKLDERQKRNVEFGALLHDIGKIAIPSEILNKPAALTEEEFAQIKEHTVIGARMLERIPFFADVHPLVRSAHERWDGGGYPDALTAGDIPLGARIICACDAFHAMTSDRPYRAAMPVVEAIAEVRRCAGRQFDPAVVDALLAEAMADLGGS